MRMDTPSMSCCGTGETPFDVDGDLVLESECKAKPRDYGEDPGRVNNEPSRAAVDRSGPQAYWIAEVGQRTAPSSPDGWQN